MTCKWRRSVYGPVRNFVCRFLPITEMMKQADIKCCLNRWHAADAIVIEAKKKIYRRDCAAHIQGMVISHDSMPLPFGWMPNSDGMLKLAMNGSSFPGR